MNQRLAVQTMEVPIADLSNEMLGRLHQLGCTVYAVHAKQKDVIIFARSVSSDALAQEVSGDGAIEESVLGAAATRSS